MHDEHPFAREGGAPRAGVVVGLQGAQLGKAGRVTAADDLPFGPDIPEGEQLGALRSLDVEAAEFVQRGIVGGKDARQIPNVRPRVTKIIVGSESFITTRAIQSSPLSLSTPVRTSITPMTR